MIKVKLFRKDKLPCGFEIHGHATDNADDENGRIVCAAVSSAAIMTANTVTDIICCRSEADEADGALKLISYEPEKCRNVLEGFELHIRALAEQYPEKIKITMEV